MTVMNEEGRVVYSGDIGGLMRVGARGRGTAAPLAVEPRPQANTHLR